MTLTVVVTGIIGLAIGIWLGMPGRYTQSIEEIDQVMEAGGGRRKKVKRIFTPVAWLQRRGSAKSNPSRERIRSRGRRSGFKLESPEDREDLE